MLFLPGKAKEFDRCGAVMADVVEAVGGGELELEDHVPEESGRLLVAGGGAGFLVHSCYFWTLDHTAELGGLSFWIGGEVVAIGCGIGELRSSNGSD